MQRFERIRFSGTSMLCFTDLRVEQRLLHTVWPKFTSSDELRQSRCLQLCLVFESTILFPCFSLLLRGHTISVTNLHSVYSRLPFLVVLIITLFIFFVYLWSAHNSEPSVFEHIIYQHLKSYDKVTDQSEKQHPITNVKPIHTSMWEFTTTQNDHAVGLSSEQCETARPKIYSEIDRAVNFRKRIGNITLEDLAISCAEDGLVRAMIVKKQMRFSPDFQTQTDSMIVVHCSRVNIRPWIWCSSSSCYFPRYPSLDNHLSHATSRHWIPRLSLWYCRSFSYWPSLMDPHKASSWRREMAVVWFRLLQLAFRYSSHMSRSGAKSRTLRFHFGRRRSRSCGKVLLIRILRDKSWWRLSWGTSGLM